MVTPFTNTGTAPSLLLVAGLLLAATRADMVTWSQCTKTFGRAATKPDFNASELMLHNCNIDHLQLDAFADFPNVYYIQLNDNNLYRVDAAVFSNVYVPDLDQLDLRRNKLRQVPIFAEPLLFPRMKTLRLSDNLITEISKPHTFSACVRMVALYLTYNHIEYVNEAVFKPLNNLTHLYLNNNRIKIISKSTFQLRSLEVITLHHNLIEYIPPHAFHGSKLTWLSISDNRIRHLPEAFISQLNNAGASLANLYFNSNPWICSCLLELTMEDKRTGISNASWRYNGAKPECVFIGRVPCHRQAPSALLAPAAAQPPPV